VITEFQGQYRFLSNFYDRPVFYQHPYMQHAIWWPTAEHALQASKTRMPLEIERIRDTGSPRDAKRLGRQATCREDWEQVKKRVMFSVLTAKFAPPGYMQDDTLARQLVATGHQILVEGNRWGDDYWGAVPSERNGPSWPPPLWGEHQEWTGHNYLGRLLMAVRDILE
jgi:ribA/ribD-fused uncharacterized protein